MDIQSPRTHTKGSYLVYRQTSGVIERLDIAKLMLIQEYNVVGKFQNRKLSEIQFDGKKLMFKTISCLCRNTLLKCIM